MTRNEIKAHEKLPEDPVFDSGGGDLHGRICSGHTELQENRQELSNERQQRVQLREELRLQQIRLPQVRLALSAQISLVI